jgi:hypothetical protein
LDELVMERRFSAENRRHCRALREDVLAPELLEALEQDEWHPESVADLIEQYRIAGSAGFNASSIARRFERIVADGGDFGWH